MARKDIIVYFPLVEKIVTKIQAAYYYYIRIAYTSLKTSSEQ